MNSLGRKAGGRWKTTPYFRPIPGLPAWAVNESIPIFGSDGAVVRIVDRPAILLRYDAGMAVAYIALGSNLGDRAGNVTKAIRLLNRRPGVAVTAVSSSYDNPAVGGPSDSPPFLNAAATVETDLSPRELLSALHAVEAEMGRLRRQKWEPRVIDLDLLLYGDRVIDGDDLKVPHPLMHERRFVLIPLAEIAADAVHPVLHKTVGELLGHWRGSDLSRHR